MNQPDTRSLRIICVCSGNICRSPMAEAIVKRTLEEKNIPAAVISSGTLDINGQPASTHARAVMKQMGYDIDGHRSQGVSIPLMHMSDAILIMAPRHERELLARDPGLAPRLVRLWEYASEEDVTTIPDPVGKDLAVFVACRDLILDCIANWAAVLEERKVNS